MTPDDFKGWRKTMGYSQAQAAGALGVSKPTIENYERGTRREDDRPVVIPHTVALACTALYLELDPWPMAGEDITIIRRKARRGE
ncbi:helix-turn-helix domain-containing protein [Pseudochelatococcus sp. B33]